MKLRLITLMVLLLPVALWAQEFTKNLATARSSYSAGNLENTRFALEQMLRDLDMAIGREVLKLLPPKAGALPMVEKEDNVTGTGGGMGLYVQRFYGAEPKRASIEIINNSPMINTLQAFLTMPMIGGMMRDENQKVIKVQGYKAQLNKTLDSETNKTDYELLIPINNTLVTVRMDESTEAEVTAFANTIPLQKIGQIAQ
ncbi:MAG: hypothetical protein MUC38_15575 [Cyclobacteriaceae bacterium]|jgi:hypothetical protein|nr:hypothetical protein [Cyclobacteriaceae bacterium]